MSNILLYTNDLELGTTLSERLLHGNNTIMFVEQLHDLNNDLMIQIYLLSIWMIKKSSQILLSK